MRYSLIWRNKWLTSDCKSLKEMVEALRGAADMLEGMDKDGIQLDSEGVEDDYANLGTDDEMIAKKYDMEEMEDEDEEWDEDDGEEE